MEDTKKKKGNGEDTLRRRHKKNGFFFLFSCHIADCKIPVAIKPFFKMKAQSDPFAGQTRNCPKSLSYPLFLTCPGYSDFMVVEHLFRYKCYSYTRGGERKGDHGPLSERCA